jgi:GrpB-like predicted nucleotidyltransferase (UPF0157 family)
MIVLVPYDDAWPARFEAEAERLRQALGAAALRIEHVGSTSVPGLTAKPVIDIQVSLAVPYPRSPAWGQLESLGYTHRPMGDFDRVYPFFKRPADWPHTHHVHLCAAGGEQERYHLAFRDWLRSHPDTAAAYVALKHELAARHQGHDDAARERYSMAKTAFVQGVLRQAGVI